MSNKETIQSAGGIVLRKDQNNWKVALLYKNNNWVLPKGRIEIGETEIKTAKREIFEELGIPKAELKIENKIGKLYYVSHLSIDDHSPRPKTVTYFLVETSYNKIRPLKNEGFEKATWFSLDLALKKLSFIESKGILLKAIKFIEKKEKHKNIDTIVISAGGRGKRFLVPNNKKPKLLFGIHRQPFIRYLLDMVIDLKFKNIYLLTGFYKNEIELFIKKTYKNNKIKIVYGGKKGIIPAVSIIKNRLKEPFIYMDGNIICKPELVKKLSNPDNLSDSLTTSAVSKKDLAPTHLQFSIKNNQINGTLPRLNIAQKRKYKNLVYSMGIIAIDNKIFDFINNIDDFNDWDLLVDHIFKTKLNTNLNFISYLSYPNEWYCIHNKKDIELINQKGASFFDSLK